MSSQLKQAFSKENLMRSWGWLNTSTDLQYKYLFRNLYQAYALSVDANISDLRKSLTSSTYNADHSIKLYLPKKSGILRPYSLLRVNDQIVYFALVSIVAEKLYPRAKKNYLKSVFGHLYAGKSSLFFYKRWTQGYKTFNAAMTSAFTSGYRWTACFDLTAYYDSIDHKVLCHFLREMGLEEEFVRFLTDCLETWTAATDCRIYHGHGIPQGPPPSGLLSEVILQYFDNNPKVKKTGVKYFRYVDDIRLMGRTESDVRRALIELDYVSKETGLFPQSSKINIHEILNVSHELKSISLPPEPTNHSLAKNQTATLARLRALTKGYKILNETRFKYVLKHAAPNSILALRLLTLLCRYPHLYESVLRYLSKFRKFSRRVSAEIVRQLKNEQLYEEVTSNILAASYNRLHPDSKADFKSICEDFYSRRKTIESPHLRSTVFVCLLNDKHFTFTQLEKIYKTPEWWLVNNSLDFIDIDLFGQPSYQSLMNSLVKSESFEIAIRAAYLIVKHDLSVTTPISELNQAAQKILKNGGKITRGSSSLSPLSKRFEEVTNMTLPPTKWKKFFGSKISNAERLSILLSAYFKTDPNAFVNSLDVFNELACDPLHNLDSTLGMYTLGNIGSVLNAPTGRFATRYPRFYFLCKRIHELRLESDLSHPIVKTTGKPTRRIKHKEIKNLRVTIHEGLQEIWLSI